MLSHCSLRTSVAPVSYRILLSELERIVRATVALKIPSATVSIKKTIIKLCFPFVLKICKNEAKNAGFQRFFPIRQINKNGSNDSPSNICVIRLSFCSVKLYRPYREITSSITSIYTLWKMFLCFLFLFLFTLTIVTLASRNTGNTMKAMDISIAPSIYKNTEVPSVICNAFR